MLPANGTAQKPSKVQVFAHIVGRLGTRGCGCPADGLNVTQSYRRKKQKSKKHFIYITSLTPNYLLQYYLPATSPFQCVFFSCLFRHLTPPTPTSTRDLPDHCLAFWVPSSPSPTCHCPTRSLSAQVQLVLLWKSIRIGAYSAGVLDCNTWRFYASWHLPESCVCQAVQTVWSQP